MSCFKLAFKLLKDNLKIYEHYLMVLVVTVATYYNFVAMRYNETYIQLANRLQSTAIASFTCGFVLLCTVIFFMWHSNGFFFKQRQKEIGLYLLMGISSSKIGMVFAIESFLLGALSIVIGLPLGILFSKLFFMLLGKAVSLNVEFPLTISFKAVLQLIIIFTLIFVFLAFKNYFEVKKSQLINMLNATKKNSTVPKLNYPKGFIGVILIIGGYIIGVNVRQQEFDLLLASMSTLIMVCLGTYLLFGSFLTIILSKLIKNVKFKYKNVRIIWLNNTFFRLKINYKTLAMTAILAASTVTAFSISLSFKQFADDNIIMESPYSFSYISNEAEVKQNVEKVINESKHQLIGVNEISFFVVDTKYLNKKHRIDHKNQAIVTSYSEIEKTLEFLNFKNKEIILDKIRPKENEVTFVLNANTIASPFFVKGEELSMNGRVYTVKEDIKVPFTGNIPTLGRKNIYVISDKEYDELKTSLLEITLNGVSITNPEESEDLISKVAEIVPGGFEKVYPYISQYVWEYYALGIFFFLGLFISVVFILATFSTLYFKILSNALLDRDQYIMLKKIGMSRKEVEKTVYVQVAMEFILPIIVGIIHSIVAMSMVEQIMNVKFTLQISSGIVLFALIITIFYLRLSKNYMKMVYQ